MTSILKKKTMRVCICFVAFGWLSPTQGFTTPNKQTRTASKQYVSGRGWDNDSFLDSLGKKPLDEDEGNEVSYGMSRYGRHEEQQQQEAAGFRGQSSNRQQFPSAKQFAREANDGFSQQYSQQFRQQQPNRQQVSTNQFMPQATEGTSGTIPPQNRQTIQPQQAGMQLQGMQQPPQGSAVSPQQPSQLQGPNSFYQQQQPNSPAAQAAAQDAFARQMAMQQQLMQQQQQYTQQPALEQPFPQGEGFPSPSSVQGRSPSNPLEREEDLPVEDIEGAVLTDEMKAKAKASHTPEEEASQGGQLFRSMMARAKQRATQQQTIQQQQQQQQQQQPLLQQPVQMQQPSQIPPNAMDLSVEEQARLFREIMAQRQQQQQIASTSPYNPYQQQQPQVWNPYAQQQATAAYAQQQLPTYPYGEQAPSAQFLPPGIGIDGRRMGRNKDADIISTSADVYLAQLKRDSSSRRLAREAGDHEKANTIFHDPKIQEITAPVNPYMKEQREKERDMIETVPEEMLLFQEYGDKPDAKARSYSGVSFKEKLAQRKAQRANSNPP